MEEVVRWHIKVFVGTSHEPERLQHVVNHRVGQVIWLEVLRKDAGLSPYRTKKIQIRSHY